MIRDTRLKALLITFAALADRIGRYPEGGRERFLSLLAYDAMVKYNEDFDRNGMVYAMARLSAEELLVIGLFYTEFWADPNDAVSYGNAIAKRTMLMQMALLDERRMYEEMEARYGRPIAHALAE